MLLTTKAGIAFVSVIAVATRGELKDRKAETFAGICEIGVAADIPMPFTSWQVEHLRIPEIHKAVHEAIDPLVVLLKSKANEYDVPGANESHSPRAFNGQDWR